ncbi:hypothetical protein PQQ72_31685 [Paraburkholderia strydomiana]|uniref:hypothetical protein n=1 Tax=Paraburkholderia strydomiana TaxID=1245417 RepID=UPI0038B6E035
MVSFRGLTIAALLIVSGCATTNESVAPQRSETSLKSTQASAPRLLTPSSREKTLFWEDVYVKDGGGTLATVIHNFKVTVTEQTSSEGTLQTNFITTWQYQNRTEDDRNKSPLRLSITLYDINNQPLEVYSGSSPRDHCTYPTSAWENWQIDAQRARNNYIDLVDHAILDVQYSASYEGGC